MIGKLRKIVPDKGFGFITGTDGKDYFFHKSAYAGFWEDLVSEFVGDEEVRLTFNPEIADKGPRAENVKRMEEDES